MTTVQIREVIERLVAAGQWRPGAQEVPGRAGRRIRRPAHRPPAGRAASSALVWRSCPAAGSTSRSDCGGRAPAPPKRTSTAAGSPSSAASTSSTHSPVQADPWVDQAPAPQPGSGRPVDLARDRRPRPASPRPTAGHRPPQALGEADRTEQTDTRPRTQRVQEPAREDRLSSRYTDTVTPRTGPAARLEEPPPRHPARGWQSPRYQRGVSRPAHHKMGTKPRRAA
jgi:hypothetical protein